MGENRLFFAQLRFSKYRSGHYCGCIIADRVATQQNSSEMQALEVSDRKQLFRLVYWIMHNRCKIEYIYERRFYVN